MFKATWFKVGLIGGLLVAVSLLHYMTDAHEIEHHAVHRRLYYLPLVFAAFWFGIKGAAAVSLSAIALYFPFALYNWRGSHHEFDTFLEGGLYVFIALTLGFLAERERREHAARIEAERLAAIGKAVSEIAHDMKSPLMAIGGFVNQVSRKLPENGPNNKKLQVVMQETARLEGMVKDMLEFGKPMELELSQADLNDLVRETVEVSKPIAAKAGVVLKMEVDESLPALELDVSRLRQVLMNLIVNAIQASPASEEIRVRTRRTKLEVILEITDCGCGIPEGEREKIFQPFFSTKKEGTGLGLAIVKKIVEAHEGRITFHPNKDKGTTFVVALPTRRPERRL
jgi:two-component system, NtrC family, sensor histidine kinase HydH